MSYWGDEPYQSDFASGSLGAVVFLTKKRLNTDIQAILKDAGHSEQSIVVLLELLRTIGERYPKGLSVHFRRKQFDEAKGAFYQWYEKCSRRIPAKHREGVLQSAEAEFQL